MPFHEPYAAVPGVKPEGLGEGDFEEAVEKDAKDARVGYDQPSSSLKKQERRKGTALASRSAKDSPPGYLK